MPDNWQSVELKHLRALRSIAETGTFWAASEQLNSSLSTVSDHVTAMEGLVGQRLIQPMREGPFEVRELMRDRYVVVAAASSQLARRRPRVADLADGPMVAFQHGKHQDMAESFMLARGIRPRVVFRSNDNGTVQAMVAAGVGVALSPLLAVDETDKKVHLAQLAEPVPPRVLVVLWHRDRYTQPALAAFVDTAMAVAAEIERAHDAFLRRRAG